MAFLRSRVLLVLVATVVGATVGGITVSAAQEESDIHACVVWGLMFYVEDDANCGRWPSVEWNQAGPQGLPGEPGPAGPAGPQGEPGAFDISSVDGCELAAAVNVVGRDECQVTLERSIEGQLVDDVDDSGGLSQGDLLRWTVTLTNNSTAAARDVLVTDSNYAVDWPTWTVLSYDASVGTFGALASSPWEIGEIPPGSNATLTIDAEALQPISAGGVESGPGAFYTPIVEGLNIESIEGDTAAVICVNGIPVAEVFCPY